VLLLEGAEGKLQHHQTQTAPSASSLSHYPAENGSGEHGLGGLSAQTASWTPALNTQLRHIWSLAALKPSHTTTTDTRTRQKSGGRKWKVKVGRDRLSELPAGRGKGKFRNGIRTWAEGVNFWRAGD